MNIGNAQQIAVIGAGLAGAACAHALTLAGRSVHVFEKHRGPGRRLATRRVERVGRLGQICTTQPDHGAAGITAHSAPFQTADRMGAAADARRTGRLSGPARRLVHCAVHRWRYALPQAQKIAAAESFFWNAAQSLGVCGDFLGGSGAEDAWLSAQSLSAAMLQRGPDAGQTSPAPAAQNAAHQAVRHFAA